MSAAVLARRPRRRVWFLDWDGVYATTKRHNDKISYEFDESEELKSETISTASWSSSGPTLSGASIDSAKHSITVTGSGEATVTVTGSGGTIFERRYRWIATDRFVKDYR